jgi:hypothetical protein
MKMDIKEMGLYAVDWIHLAQDRDWWRALVSITNVKAQRVEEVFFCLFNDAL